MIRLDQICLCKKPERMTIALADLIVPICRVCGGIYVKAMHR